MVDKKKIQEAAVSKFNPSVGSEALTAERIAFAAGVEWFKNALWHNIQEEPEKGEFIVTEFFDVGKCYEIDSASWTEDWEEHCNRNHIMAWCYVSDLLP